MKLPLSFFRIRKTCSENFYMVEFWKNGEPVDCFPLPVKRKEKFVKHLKKDRERLGFEIIDESGVA